MNIQVEHLNKLITLVEKAIDVGREGTDTQYTAPGIVMSWIVENNIKVGYSNYD